MICKFCQHKRSLIEAHVIPKSFFRELTGKASASIMLENIPGSFPKRLPKGPYDKNLVCSKCEQQFSAWDDYAQEFLLQNNEFNEIKSNNDLIAYSTDKCDYKKLKLFFISILWRASASTHGFFDKVKLGPYENVVKDLILKKDPADEDTFAVTLCKYENPFNKVIIEPIPIRWFGVNYYRFYLTGYTADIKVDKRGSPEHMGRLKLKLNSPCIFAVKNTPSEMEYELLSKAIRKIVDHSC